MSLSDLGHFLSHVHCCSIHNNQKFENNLYDIYYIIYKYDIFLSYLFSDKENVVHLYEEYYFMLKKMTS